jgi:hypothetical protein
MEHNRARRIALLLDDADGHAFSLCAFPQIRQQFETLTRSPRKSLVQRDHVKNV